VYGISESAMLPSRPMTTPFATHKSYEACTEYLSRERTSDDYHYIAKSDGKGTHNEPYLFTTHMSAYKSVFLSRKSISTFREEEHCIRAAKEAERRKLDLALKMKAAEELVEERMRERFEMIEQELVGKGDTSSSAAVPASYPVDDKSSIELPLPLASNDHANIHEDDELEQLASLLLKNTNFLKALARKLNLPDEQVVNLDATPDASFSSKSAGDVNYQAVIEPAAPVLQQLLARAAPPLSVPKLKLNCKRYRTSVDQVTTRGDGWNRLSRSDTIMGDDFSLTKRQTLKGSGQPKFNRLEDNRNFICVNPATEEKYQFDQRHFKTTPQSVFIPDLATERLRLAKQYRQRTKMNNETMLTALQQQSMNEILQLPVSNEVPREEVAIGPTGPESDLLNIQLAVTKSVNVVGTEMNARPFDYAAQAILAVKTQNLSDLEQLLDTGGVSVETRDQHGNSLFILACQQGSKKLAKFLLKRGADVNSQNNGGNTALHYLHEYKHLSLAEYLLRKGANDSIKNVLLRTCYEGLEASEDE
jgi:ankyrin repeat protein